MSNITVIPLQKVIQSHELSGPLSACGFFGSPEWLSTLQDTYGYRPQYLIGTDKESRTVFMLPLMEVQSLLTGCRGISTPFSDYCEIYDINGLGLHEIISFLRNYGHQRGWRYFELRAENSAKELGSIPAYGSYYVHTMNIQAADEELFRSFSQNTRRNIVRAEKSGLSACVSTNWRAMLDFYELHTLTRKHHGLPPQPLVFFKNLHKKVISKGLGMSVTVSRRGTPIAGNIYLQMGTRAWYKFGALDRNHASSRAPFIAMWEGIRALRNSGIMTLCLGRSDTSAAGLIRYKDGWGAGRRIIRYVRYDYTTRGFKKKGRNGTGLASSFFSHMPPGLLQLAGKVLYRHMA